jgi:hypothetical protein
VRKNFDDGHCSVYELNGVDTLAGQRLLDAAIHAAAANDSVPLARAASRLPRRRIIAGDGRARRSSGRRCCALLGAEHIAIRVQRACVASSMRSASTRGLDQGAGLHVFLGRGKAVLQHLGDLVVGEAVGRLDVDMRFDAAGRSVALTDSRPSASTVKVTRMRAAPAAMGGMPRSSKRARLRQSATSSRSPCTTCMARAVWPSL